MKRTFILTDKKFEWHYAHLTTVNPFRDAFQKACEASFDDPLPYVEVRFGPIVAQENLKGEWVNDHQWCVRLDKRFIKVQSDYVPGHWNVYPEVEPPEGVPMMLMYREALGNGMHQVTRVKAVFKNGRWMTPEGEAVKFPDSVTQATYCPVEDL